MKTIDFIWAIFIVVVLAGFLLHSVLNVPLISIPIFLAMIYVPMLIAHYVNTSRKE